MPLNVFPKDQSVQILKAKVDLKSSFAHYLVIFAINSSGYNVCRIGDRVFDSLPLVDDFFEVIHQKLMSLLDVVIIIRYINVHFYTRYFPEGGENTREPTTWNWEDICHSGWASSRLDKDYESIPVAILHKAVGIENFSNYIESNWQATPRAPCPHAHHAPSMPSCPLCTSRALTPAACLLWDYMHRSFLSSFVWLSKL